MTRFDKNNYFLKNFEQIEIPTEFVLFNKNPNNLKTVRLSSLNSSTTPALKYRVYLLFQLKDINIKENNETSNARSSSETTNNARPRSTSARSNSEKTNNARPRSSIARSNSETTNNARPWSTSAKGGKKLKTRKKYNNKQIL
jgi:hypothetical protein